MEVTAGLRSARIARLGDEIASLEDEVARANVEKIARIDQPTPLKASDPVNPIPGAGVSADRTFSGKPVRKPALHGLDPHLVSLVAPGSFEAEQYRRLCLVVEHLHETDAGAVVAVSSPGAGDGKSTTAINLAGALAQDPKARVLLIDVDLHRPSVALRKLLALGKQPGVDLVHAVQYRNVGLAQVVRHLADFNLSVLPAGGCPLAPYEVLRSPRLEELLGQARQQYDYVILDAPPIVPVSDCRLIERWVDGFLVVVAANRTRRGMLEEALNLMKPDKVLGLVFNFHDHLPSRYSPYGYGYAYARSLGVNRRR